MALNGGSDVDFIVWQTNFPTTPGPDGAPVPEPKSAMIFDLRPGFENADLGPASKGNRRWNKRGIAG